MEVNAQRVIENLVEQNRQLTLQIAILKAALEDPEERKDSKEQFND